MLSIPQCLVGCLHDCTNSFPFAPHQSFREQIPGVVDHDGSFIVWPVKKQLQSIEEDECRHGAECQKGEDANPGPGQAVNGRETANVEASAQDIAGSLRSQEQQFALCMTLPCYRRRRGG